MSGNYEQRDNSGSLFKNDDKQEENHADYNGSCKVNGVDYFMNAWVKESKNGRKFMSFSFKKKTKQSGGGSSSDGGTQEAEDFF